MMVSYNSISRRLILIWIGWCVSISTNVSAQSKILLSDPPGRPSAWHSVEDLAEATMSLICRIENSNGYTSGALISGDGLILTCAHKGRNNTLALKEKVTVVFDQGDHTGTYSAKVIKVGDMQADIALLKAEGFHSQFWIPVDLTSELRAGADVVALGYPNFPEIGGVGLAVSRGSMLVVKYGPRNAPRMVSDTAIASGSSGGPLISAALGRIVGVNVSVSSLGTLEKTGSEPGKVAASRVITLSVPTSVLASRMGLVSHNRGGAEGKKSEQEANRQGSRKKTPPSAPTPAKVVDDKFIELYKGSNSPRLLFISESSSRRSSEVAERLLSTIRSHFQVPEVKVISEFVAVTDSSIDASAADMLIRVFVEESAQHSYLVCRYEIIDLRRSEEIGSHPWTMPLTSGDDVRLADDRIRSYAQAVAQALAEDFESSLVLDRDWAPFRSFRVNLVSPISLPATKRVEIVQAISLVPHVKPGSVRIFDQELNLKDDLEVLAIECDYSGALSELQADINEVLLSKASLGSKLMKLKEGSIDLIIFDINFARQKNSETEKDYASKNLVSFSETYKKAGSPRIGISVGFDHSISLNQIDTIIGIANSEEQVEGSAVYAQVALDEIEAIARGIVDDWGSLGIEIKIIAKSVRAETENSQSIRVDFETARSLGRAAGTRIIIIGVIKIVESGIGVEQPYIRYEFAMYDLQEGLQIASDAAKLNAMDLRRVTPETRKQVIAWFTQRLAKQAVRNW